MMKRLRKLFVFLFVLCMVLLSTFAAEAASTDIIHTEKSGSITVTVYKDGLVKYQGTGALKDKIYYEIDKIVKVEIGEGITEIGTNAFWGCAKLKSVKLPATLKTIGPNAFSECVKLTSVTLPDGLKKIGSGAFYGSGLTSITIPDSVTSLAYDIATGESALGAFDCPNLSKVKLGKGITNIPWGCFSSTAIEGITIPAGVTRIEAYAFGFCSKLTSVTIPAKVKYIGDMAFVNTFSLTNVIFLGNLPQMNAPLLLRKL